MSIFRVLRILAPSIRSFRLSVNDEILSVDRTIDRDRQLLCTIIEAYSYLIRADPLTR
ncbi:hypothetical protein HUB94_04590 [Paenibacillus cellulosilyticus]|nr:hypothetical protein HUB94_04590 [Paenibacillus cellulosilyticus]